MHVENHEPTHMHVEHHVPTYMNVECVLVSMTSLFHVGTQGRDGRGALLECWREGQERHMSQRVRAEMSR